ncbi:hypothetical protein SS50377_21898 [Spironucleus salmonicida]|uniref:Myb-like DNA-binding domain-containing protein n=1 Tax=Spironucleus salmonicida TaxID=348837 RepID=V6LUF3_9EUKA|nr:hypothetical protein SS50377_21898 [Spironucleus salmonicida]|eukprot:EST44439.1 Hypothetical protein SS50377_15747 [Spironucleus salmonicida]
MSDKISPEFTANVLADLYCKQLHSQSLPDTSEVYAETLQQFTNSPLINILLKDTVNSQYQSSEQTNGQSYMNITKYNNDIVQILQDNPDLHDSLNKEKEKSQSVPTSISENTRLTWTLSMEHRLSSLMDQKKSYVYITQILNDEFGLQMKPNQVSQRWNRVQNPAILKGRWMQEDIERLEAYIKRNLSVSEIHSKFPGRTLLQIQKRIKIQNTQAQ